MLKDRRDYQSFFDDTMRAGHFENDPESVDIMINSSQDVLKDLLSYGVDFHREKDGSLSYTREGAHSEKRILFHEDVTGKEITSKLLAQVRKKENITILEHTTLLDILCYGNKCYGGIIRTQDGSIDTIEAKYTVLASGGVGGLYKHSTNFKHLTGDALAICAKHDVELLHPDYVQIHPTTFYVKDDTERSFLISESVRGEGALLYGKDRKRFVDELKPRDVVANAIFEQMKKDQTEYVWEDLTRIPKEELQEHFPNIVEHCREKGYDVFTECIPVVPAQHYFMGGVKVDHESRTTMAHLFAVGETACNGVHGKNRLASNSLLESLVFAKRAASVMKHANIPTDDIGRHLAMNVNLDQYADKEAFENEYRHIALEVINQ